MAHPDPRIQRTQTALTKAMIALTLERGYAAITIRDLAERAGIGYATFFRHYPDKAALLDDVLAEFVAELLALLAADGAAASPAERGVLIFRYIEAHEPLARVLLASQDLAALTRRLTALSAAHLPGASLAGSAQIPPEIAAHHLVVASIGLIQWWLDHHRPYPAERMGEVFAALVIAPVEALQTAARA